MPEEHLVPLRKSSDSLEPERTSGRWARANRRVDTLPEVRLRSVLHRRGFRFRKNALIRLPETSVRPDIVFSRVKVAVFVDGCFWHRCPTHGGTPKSHVHYWTEKFERIVQRDCRVNMQLDAAGWTVVRLWEHLEADEAADIVARTVMAARSRIITC